MKMTNRGNRFIYRLWAPIYDAVVGRLFLPGRKRALELLDLQPGERVLLVGCGTGSDLPLLPRGIEVVGVDLSPEMLARARKCLPRPDLQVTLVQGDAQQLLVEQASCDAVVFHLILSVIPDGAACLHQNLRALKPGGRAIVFDKFAPESGTLSPFRRSLNWFSTAFGTDITRRFSTMLEGSGGMVVSQEPSILGGQYKIILLRKTAEAVD
jgi:phosphatidylethanolamine/phosphatidyl-N-methylethanolamine N-methyltransferase